MAEEEGRKRGCKLGQCSTPSASRRPSSTRSTAGACLVRFPADPAGDQPHLHDQGTVNSPSSRPKREARERRDLPSTTFALIVESKVSPRGAEPAAAGIRGGPWSRRRGRELRPGREEKEGAVARRSQTGYHRAIPLFGVFDVARQGHGGAHRAARPSEGADEELGAAGRRAVGNSCLDRATERGRHRERRAAGLGVRRHAADARRTR